jgi:hypothetical protein
VEGLTDPPNQPPLPHGEEPAQRASRTIWHNRGFHPSRRRYAAPQDEVRQLWRRHVRPGPTEYGSAISRHDLPEAWRVPPEREGAGNAGCALHPRSRVQWVEGNAHEHTGSAEAIRHSLRKGLSEAENSCEIKGIDLRCTPLCPAGLLEWVAWLPVRWRAVARCVL